MQDTLPVLLRLLDEEEMAKYDCMTPTALDYLADYYIDEMPFKIDLGTNADASHVRPVIYIPQGHADVVPADNATEGTRPTSYMSYANNVLSHDINRQVFRILPVRSTVAHGR